MIHQNEDLRMELGSVPSGESPLPSEFNPDLSIKFYRRKTCQPKQPWGFLSEVGFIFETKMGVVVWLGRCKECSQRNHASRVVRPHFGVGHISHHSSQ